MNGMRDSTYTLKAKITKAWGGVTVADAQLINDNVIFSGLTGIYRACADVTGDNRFLANDAQQTARRAADLQLPIPLMTDLVLGIGLKNLPR